ncbi:unnamed protein product [Knipowitschia caucasica]|uniref:BTB domain-containing protein n=1 Tax=Knipowitschia caucasica TaxID=637954 RepID=A0AAV2ML90_KNICA
MDVYSDDLRRRNVFCDAVLKVEDSEFPCHKLQLCHSSKYFRAMFESAASQNENFFRLKNISPRTMALILDWIYTQSTPSLSRHNVQEVLKAASTLMLEKLVQICYKFLEDHLLPENSIGMWHQSDVIVSESMKECAQRFILRHFEEVAASDEFLELSVQELLGFIENDTLDVRSETAVFEAIVRWTNHDLQNRKNDFSRLLEKVRFSEISNEYVKTNVLKTSLVGPLDYRNIVLSGLNTSPRLPGAILLAIGGWSGGDPTHVIEAFDLKANRWVNVTNHQESPRAYHGVVFLNGGVYCVGGFNRLKQLNTMRRLDLATNRWHEMPPMYHRRSYVSVTVMHGCIYAIGGFDGALRLNTAEVFNPQTNQWSLIAQMNQRRSDANCATLDDKIYICGGFDGTQVFETAECYCANTKQWTFIAPMTSRRSGVSFVAYSGHIYAVGGFDGVERLRSVEAYNPRTNSWHEVAPMITTRSNFGLEVLNDRFYAVGGYNGVSTTWSVETYDPLVDRWSEAQATSLFRSALSCCVISGIPNMADYTVARDMIPLLDVDSDEDNN